MVDLIPENEWHAMFDVNGYQLLSHFIGRYVAISYITDRRKGEETSVSKLGNFWVVWHGHEREDLERAIPFLASLGCGRIWLDSVTAPMITNMTKVQSTYERASVVYGVLNRTDSQHLQQVVDAMRTLQLIFEQPKTGLPAQYKQQQRLCPEASTHYESDHTYWTRVRPYAEQAVAENFTYVAQNGKGSYDKFPLQQLRNASNRLRSTYDSDMVQAIAFPGRVKDLIERDVNAAELHVSRFTLKKVGALTDADDLLRRLIEAPRHTLDWSSMLGALAVFEPRMKVDQKSPEARLVQIATVLCEAGIVNQPTLGQYKAKQIQSSFLPPTNRAKWDAKACKFLGGGSATTAVLTRIGRVIGEHRSPLFPNEWTLDNAYIIPERTYMRCYVGSLAQHLAKDILRSASSKGSASSISSEHEESHTTVLVERIPENCVSYIAVRGDRYAYVLNQTKQYIVGYVGYGVLQTLKFRFRDCKREELVIEHSIA
jgi:hypothetical protein